MTTVIISGHDVILDNEDVNKVIALKWYVNKRNASKYGLYYFEHMEAHFHEGKRTRSVISLHRYLMGCTFGDGKQVDHIDCNTLNNQKSNMRICTNRENNCNKKLLKRNTSGLMGATYNKRDKRWYSTIKVNGKGIHLGCFSTPEEAHEAYKSAAIKYNGEFARFE